MSNETKSVFETLSAINCNEHTEKKNGLTYLAWAWAWQMVKQNFPKSFYTIYENKDGLNYHHDGRTAWVKTGVTVVWDENGEEKRLELIEDLPVMDFRNASIKLEQITSFDVNKAIQRSLTKACARHGLGLYIYAGEDLPENGENTPTGASNGSGSARTTSPAPAAPTAPTKPQAAKPQKSAKAKEAWKEFCTLSSVKSMDDTAKSKFFFATLKSALGKDDPKKVTDEEWQKFIEHIDFLRTEG